MSQSTNFLQELNRHLNPDRVYEPAADYCVCDHCYGSYDSEDAVLCAGNALEAEHYDHRDCVEQCGHCSANLCGDHWEACPECGTILCECHVADHVAEEHPNTGKANKNTMAAITSFYGLPPIPNN